MPDFDPLLSSSKLPRLPGQAPGKYVTHRGGCHCGAVRFEVDASEDLVAFDCNCSICLKKRNAHFVVPQAKFRLLQGARNLSTYRFGTQVAKHTFCTTCGVHAFYQPRSNPDGFGVSPHCLDSGTVRSLEVRYYNGQDWEAGFEETGIGALSKENGSGGGEAAARGSARAGGRLLALAPVLLALPCLLLLRRQL
jgi:hypothetical protein